MSILVSCKRCEHMMTEDESGICNRCKKMEQEPRSNMLLSFLVGLFVMPLLPILILLLFIGYFFLGICNLGDSLIKEVFNK